MITLCRSRLFCSRFQNNQSRNKTLSLRTDESSDIITPTWKKKYRASNLIAHPQQKLAYDGCTAASYVAYAWSEQAFIYPITPATPMGDVTANWSGQGRKNLFGSSVTVTQMQSEGGAAGACHGVVDVGSMATTFTSSQGLLLMIPNMYIIAGALNPCVFHVAARAVTKHALCIFGDHTDVMAARQTGFAQLSGHNVQQCMDMGLVAHIASLKSSIPFMNFFDGFRTSHEIAKIDIIPYESMEQLIPWKEVNAFRKRGLNPNHPHSRQLGQFSDTFFQNSESLNKYYENVPRIVQETMDDVAQITGRHYRIMEYVGHDEPEFVAVIMGSGAQTMESQIRYDVQNHGEKFGMIKIHLYRPWDAKTFLNVLPRSTKKLAVLDRTKEQTALGEPLFLDVASTLQSVGNTIKVVGGRYGLGSKDFTPAMSRAVFENLKTPSPIESFSVGIEDDVTFRSIPVGPEPDVSTSGTRQCIFWGMGSDGTVSANKNAIKMISDNTDLNVQAYFAYDSKKAGGCTISHLRFGPNEIDSPYSIMLADYIAVSQRTWPDKFPNVILQNLKSAGTCVFNTSAHTEEQFLKEFPLPVIKQIGAKQAKVYTIDATKVALESGLGRHTNNILQSVFFKLADVLPFEQAEKLLKDSMRKAYAAKGEELVIRNTKGVDQAIRNLRQIEIEDYKKWEHFDKVVEVEERNPFCEELMDPLNRLEGDNLPVSSFDPRGHYPNGTTVWEKRGIALTVPIVDMDKCTQCNKCAAICPHAAIRPFLVSQLEVDQAPKNSDFEMRFAKGGNELAGYMFRIQVAPEDCTGCEACSWACPDDALTMTPLTDVVNRERENWSFAINLPNRGYLVDGSASIKSAMFQQPMLEFSGACEGCGETPYAKLVTQLFGHRMIVANASGCSSVWAGTAAFSPLATNESGHGPAWGRSLFEDAAEYGMGMSKAVFDRRDALAQKLQDLITDEDYRPLLSSPFVHAIKEWLEKRQDAQIAQELSVRIQSLFEKEPNHESLLNLPVVQEIVTAFDLLPKISMWVWGGDGWAYDIGFGGLDHVLASKTNVNILVMDTEGYSNTGGQVSKSTNLGAVQKFAPTGYRRPKKDLGAIAMAYEDVYVASVSLGANYGQTVKAFVEAEEYPGTSIILCYSPCIEHKILFPRGLSRLGEEMKMAVDAGYWSLYRYNPSLVPSYRAPEGYPEIRGNGNPFQLDSKRLSLKMEDFTKLENRFEILRRTHPEVAKQMKKDLQRWADERHDRLKWMENRWADSETSAAVFEDLAILYGTDTGTTAEVSTRLASLARSRGFRVSLLELDEVTPEDFQDFKNVLVLCSTAGEGEFPANAHEFWEAFGNLSDESMLKNVKYCVFGLGDSGYKHFNQAAKNIDEKLSQLGANRVMTTGLGDDKHEDKFETELEQWLPEFWKVHNAPEAPDEHEIAEPLFELEMVNKADSLYQQVIPPGTKVLTLEKNARLTDPSYDRIIRHLVFDVKDKDDFSYLLGDALTLYPTNNPDTVSKFLEWYSIDPTDYFKVKPLVKVDARRNSAYRHAMSTMQIFTEVVDILGRPNKHFYKQLLKFAVDEGEAAELRTIVSDTPEGNEKYAALVNETVNYYDALQMFPSAHPPIEHLMSLIPCIKPRLYSIASSQRFVNDKIELAIVILDWKTPKGVVRRGLSTDYIERLRIEEGTPTSFQVPCSVTPGTFNFPSNLTDPYVMCGLGTGLAPFRAFVQERAHFVKLGFECGPMWLFYGCRFEKKDYIFGDELKKFKKANVLTELRPAFSRDQKEKIYVQHRMKEVEDQLYEDLFVKNGYFYLCGQAGQLETDVRNALKSSIKRGLGDGATDKKVDEIFNKFDEEGRYCLELY